jgi:hypothetical protein
MALGPLGGRFQSHVLWARLLYFWLECINCFRSCSLNIIKGWSQMINIQNSVFDNYVASLKKQEIPPALHADYKKWLRYYLDFCAKYVESVDKSERITPETTNPHLQIRRWGFALDAGDQTTSWFSLLPVWLPLVPLSRPPSWPPAWPLPSWSGWLKRSRRIPAGCGSCPRPCLCRR